MTAPIIEFFDGKEIINKNAFLNSCEEAKDCIEKLKKYNINSCLFIFSKTFYEDYKEHLEEFYDFGNAGIINKVYIYDKSFLVVSCSIGGPCGANLMEELGFLGITKFFACGSAGQIDEKLDGSNFILVEKAIRDEGLSYKYLPSSVYVETDKELTDLLADYLGRKNFKYVKAITWTTDAFYRETPEAVEKRKEQGAVAVEMECASWSAVSKKRNYQFAQLLYFSDVVKQEVWNWKSDLKDLKNSIIDLMIEFMDSLTLGDYRTLIK